MRFRWSRVILFVLWAVTLAAVPVVSTGAALAAVYYVSPDGDDQGPGSLESPWRTLNKANQVLEPGDTVYLRGGEYVRQQIRPARSGTPGNYITYAAYPGETPVLTSMPVVINLVGRQYVRIDGLTVDGKNGYPNATVDKWADLDNAQHIIIENSTFRNGNGWTCVSLDGTSRYNILRNNVMDHCGAWEVNGADYGDMIVMDDGEYILIEGNRFSRGGHNIIRHSGQFNVIRNNYFDNRWGPNIGNRSLSLVRAHNPKGGWTVFEGNVVVHTLGSSDSPTSVSAFKTAGTNYIVRRNFVIHSSVLGTKTESYSNDPVVTYNKIYHNVFYDLGSYAWWLNAYTGGSRNENNVFKNNLVYKSRQGQNQSDHDVDVRVSLNPIGGGIRNNYVIANSFFKAAPGDARVHVQGIGTYPLDWFEANHPEFFRQNVQAHPGIVSANPEKPEDFMLNSTSPLIDAGDFLTRTTSGGSGTVIPVEDAGYFTDGFGIVEPDWIQVGRNAPVQIVSIDYRAHTITVAQPITWKAGDGVSLPYEGSAPDIGAWESPYNAQGIRIDWPVAGVPVELWTEIPLRLYIGSGPESEPQEVQVLLDGEEIFRGPDLPDGFTFTVEGGSAGEGGESAGQRHSLTVRVVDAGGSVRERSAEFTAVRPPTRPLALVSSVRQRLEPACGTLELAFEPLRLPPDEFLQEVRILWGPFSGADPAQLIELYAGREVPARVPVNTRLFTDDFYKITVWNRTDRGEATSEYRVRVDNVSSLTDQLLAPAFGGFMDLLRTVDRSKGWAFVAGNEAAFNNDNHRMTLGGESSEYLTWRMAGLSSFVVTLYARDEKVQEALEIAVSADGQSWRTVPYTVHTVGGSAGGYLTLRVEADVRAGGGEGAASAPRADFVRLSLKPVFPADALQLGEVTMTGLNC